MAKSLRSKWKRKMKAIKRVRYGQKENDRLIKMLKDAKADEESKSQEVLPDKDPGKKCFMSRLVNILSGN